MYDILVATKVYGEQVNLNGYRFEKLMMCSYPMDSEGGALLKEGYFRSCAQDTSRLNLHYRSTNCYRAQGAQERHFLVKAAWINSGTEKDELISSQRRLWPCFSHINALSTCLQQLITFPGSGKNYSTRRVYILYMSLQGLFPAHQEQAGRNGRRQWR